MKQPKQLTIKTISVVAKLSDESCHQIFLTTEEINNTISFLNLLHNHKIKMFESEISNITIK